MSDTLVDLQKAISKEVENSRLLTETEPAVQKNLAQLINQEDDIFSQFFVCIWTTDPNRDHVRVILDDGGIKLFVKRDKFISLMEKVIDIDAEKTSYNFFKMKQSMHTYGGWYFYDRINDEFRELQEQPNMQRIRPLDLITEARRPFVQQHLENKFAEMRKANETTKKFKSQYRPISVSSAINKIFSPVIRNFNKK
jgi:hypothetical protein